MKPSLRVIGVIPARYKSTRFPAKLLSDINGKPLLQYTYENSLKVDIFDELVVATDDERIFQAVKKFNGKVVMTSAEHRSGTDRVAEVAKNIDCDLVVNIQGDEVLIKPDTIKDAVQLLTDDYSAVMSTAAFKIHDPKDYNDRNVVKVVIDSKGYALYFSRAPLPHSKTAEMKDGYEYYQHIGMYCYRRDFLLEYSKLPKSKLEEIEGLEQLRALENGYKIKVAIVDDRPMSVNTYEDLEDIRKMLCQSISS